MRKLVFKFRVIEIERKREIIKNIIKNNLFSKFDLIHFNLGPIAIANKKGIKNE